MKPINFYIASKLENAEVVRRVAGILTHSGHHHTYDWTLHGSVSAEGIDRLREVADLECQGVLWSNLLILLLPAGRGTHTELGMALALGKQVVLCGAPEDKALVYNDPCAFYHHEKVTICLGNLTDWMCAIFNAIGRIQREREEMEETKQ